jgi:PDZ domain-containing protein
VTRRGLTLLLALVLAIGLAVAGAMTTVPYAALTPGPAYNTLSAVDGKKVLTITGHGEYKDSGALSLTTVSVQDHITLLEALRGWLSSSEAVVPREVVFPPSTPPAEQEKQNVQQMLESQNSATTAAFRELGIPMTTVVTVGAVTAGSPASASLKVGDVLTTVDGQAITAPEAVGKLIGKHKAGEAVTLGYTRGGRAGTALITTIASTDKPVRPVIGISVASKSTAAVSVDITLDNVGGPSAGLMFALGIIDKLGDTSRYRGDQRRRHRRRDRRDRPEDARREGQGRDGLPRPQRELRRGQEQQAVRDRAGQGEHPQGRPQRAADAAQRRHAHVVLILPLTHPLRS